LPEVDILHERSVNVEVRRSVDHSASEGSGLTRFNVEEHLARARRLAIARSCRTVGTNDRRVDPVDPVVHLIDAEEILDLLSRQAGVRSLTCRTSRTVQGSTGIEERDRDTRIPLNDTGKFPTTEQFVRPTPICEEPSSLSERQLIDAVELERV